MAQAGVLEQRPDSARPGRSATGPSAPVAVDRRVLWLALGVFAVVTALGLRSHTLWFDEVQAWNIARASNSLGDLWSNLRYEGHPVLWYLPLFVLTRFTGNPHAMQVLQFAIAVSTAALVLFRAPFRVSLRVALLAGYFLAFEYGVFSRSYGLGALLVVSVLVLIGRDDPRWGAAAVVTVALAWTSLPGAVLAGALGATVLLDRRRRATRHGVAFAGVAIVAAAVVAVTCIPPDDFGNLTPGIGDSSRFGSGFAVRLASSASATWRALVPIPASVGEWNSNLLDHQAGAVWIEAILSIALFAVVLVALRRHAFAHRLWWIGSLGLVVFFVVVTRPEAARHSGFVFLLFVSCAWFAAAPPGGEDGVEPVERGARDLFGTLLVVVAVAQIVAMLAVYPSASTEDFSRDRVLADAVERAGLEDAIVSAQDWDATTIGGYLDRPVYSLARGEPIRFLVTDARQERGLAGLDTRVVTCAAIARANALDGPAALVVEARLRGREPLVVSDGAAVYEVEPGSLPPECP